MGMDEISHIRASEGNSKESVWIAIMKKFLYKIWAKFLTIFGDIKIFKWPMFVVYDDSEFGITGEKTIEIMEILQPGDVILRGFDCYADGAFIPGSLKFSHGAVYVGDNKVIHVMAEGVMKTDIVEFTRCDRIAIMRPRKYQKRAISKAKKFLKDNVPYDFIFENNASALYCFELCGECYDKLEIPKKTVSKFLGLIKKKDVVLAESFFESKDFDCVFQYNPKFNIDFRK